MNASRAMRADSYWERPEAATYLKGRHPVALLDRCMFRDPAGSSRLTGCQRLATIAADKADAPSPANQIHFTRNDHPP
jgi:hypothetical protein